MAVLATTIRPMSAADVAPVAELERRSFPQPWSQGVLLAEATGRDRVSLVAEDEAGRVLGYGGVLVTAGEAHVMTLAVDPAARRRGIASRLVAALVAAAAEEGAHDATLEVRTTNRAAIALYRRFGFEPAGIRPRYYPDADALVMWARGVGSGEFLERAGRIAGRSA